MPPFPSENENAPHNQHLASCRNWLSFWSLGTINNFAYVVILCGAANLADSFNAGKLTGFVQWANVAVGVGVRMLNVYCLNTSTNARFYAVTISFLLGYAILASSVYFNFWISITAIIAIGGACSFGESLLLGYMKNYPSSVTGGWASGTGMAGVGGSAYYLLFWLLLHDHFGLNCTNSLFIIFASLIPLTIIYLLVFMFGPTRPVGMKGGCSCTDRDNNYVNPLIINDGRSDGVVESNTMREDKTDSTPLLRGTDDSTGNNENYTESSNERNSQRPNLNEPYWTRICRLLRSVLSVSIQLGLVYFFEYVASVAFAIHAPSYVLNGGWWCDHGYTVLQFCYQSGVLLSRSSLSFFRIKNIKIITITQGINFIGWYLNAQYHYLPTGFQIVWMIWVGCMGGCMYVNVFANLVDDQTIKNSDRELSINLVAFSMNIGIVCSAIFQLIADNTFLSHDHSCNAALNAQCGTINSTNASVGVVGFTMM
jgi:battenin